MMKEVIEFDYQVNFIIIGNPAVGKSNILLKYIKNQFKSDHEITLGVDFGFKNLEYAGTKYKIRVWDTAGSEMFRSVTNAYYKDCACALIVYDISDMDSFQSIPDWIKNCKTFAPRTVQMILVGNKIDLEDNRVVKKEEGERLAKENRMPFFETSAKSGVNISTVFLESIKLIDKKIKDNFYDQSTETGIKESGKNKEKTIMLNNENIKKKSGSCSC